MQVVYLQNVPIKVHTICNRVLIVGEYPPQEEHRLRVFENRVLRRIFRPKRVEVTGD
jgi:hypothetical protein